MSDPFLRQVRAGIRAYVLCVAVIGFVSLWNRITRAPAGHFSCFELEGSAQAAEKTPAKEKPNPAATPAAAPIALGSIEGEVLFDGEVPAASFIVAPGRAGPGGIILARGIPNETLVVNSKTKGIANVIIYLPKAPPGYIPEVPKAVVTLDQDGFQFVPHVSTVQTGQKMEFMNRDPRQAYVHTLPARNAALNFVVPAAGPKPVGFAMKAFHRPERMPVKVVSDIHPWMLAYVLPLDHPFMAVTDSFGRFSIPNLPAGTHEFYVWQERSSLLDRKLTVTVTGGNTTKVPLKYSAVKFK